MLRILLIEDDERLAALTARYLEAQGCRRSTARRSTRSCST
jgi:DNA-binding response OmpR family regulator